MKRNEATLLTVLALAGSLTAIPFSIGGGLYIPYCLLFALTAYLFLRHYGELTSRDLGFLGACFILLTANLIFSGIEGFQHQMKALIQLMAALGFAVFVPKLCLAMGLERMRSVLAWTLTIVLIIAFLERLGGPVRELSDTWRHFIFNNSGFTDPYASDARDMNMVGFIRPKVFSPEPAYLAGLIFTCVACLGFLVERISRLALLLVANLIAWILIGSPVLLLSLLAVSGISLYKCRAYFLYLAPPLLLASALVVLNPPPVLEKTYAQIELRFSGILEGDARSIQDDSIRSRLYVPFAIGVPTAINYNPIWGVGIGGKEKLSKIIDPNYSHYSEGIGSTEETLGTNALGSMLATLGIVGFIGLGALVIWYWSDIGAGAIVLSMGAIFMFLFTRGAYETQAFWLSAFLMLAAAGAIGSTEPKTAQSLN